MYVVSFQVARPSHFLTSPGFDRERLLMLKGSYRPPISHAALSTDIFTDDQTNRVESSHAESTTLLSAAGRQRA